MLAGKRNGNLEICLPGAARIANCILLHLLTRGVHTAGESTWNLRQRSTRGARLKIKFALRADADTKAARNTHHSSSCGDPPCLPVGTGRTKSGFNREPFVMA